MKNCDLDLINEKEYLKSVIDLIHRELDIANVKLKEKRKSLIDTRKDMWENTSHSSSDFNKLTEVNQHLTELNNQTADYLNRKKRVEKFNSIKNSPYFARFDFQEEGSLEEEKIYIGKYNMADSNDHTIYVYDWRAPISSIFYRYELGNAKYDAPIGKIKGKVSLKRQYNIRNGNLDYMFDCNVVIKDKILQEVLSKNSSPKMRNIIETIQKEQDLIIRDSDSNVLIVQGVAGSGKSSIALHRIAFLLYEGFNSKINTNDILILSPNSLFGKYINMVLPELGENNVKQTTIDDIFDKILASSITRENRNAQVERLINSDNFKLHSDTIKFKGSLIFLKILDRLIDFYEHNKIDFNDIYYLGKVIETRQNIKNQFLLNKIGLPVSKRLDRIKNSILHKLAPYRAKKLEIIEEFIQKSDKHDFSIKSVSRLILMKESKMLKNSFIDLSDEECQKIYALLWKDKSLFYTLGKDLELPSNIEDILDYSLANNSNMEYYFEDVAPIVYIYSKIFGTDIYKNIRQLVVDEAQDYYPIHYKLINILFKDSKCTILGDINQSLEKHPDMSFYNNVSSILNRKKVVSLILNKSYRASFELNSFSKKLLNENTDFIAFERFDQVPMLIVSDNQYSQSKTLLVDIQKFLNEGFESIAIICKSREQSHILYSNLNKELQVSLVINSDDEIDKGIIIIPSYLSKGLEFDVVLVYDVDDDNYKSSFDKKLLYVAVTRALHRLSIYAVKNMSRLVPKL